MGYTDLTQTFRNNKRLDWQEFDQLAENDAWLRSNWSKYKRPGIGKVVGSDTRHYVFVQPNGPDVNTSKILFPDGDLRSVTENIISPPPFVGNKQYRAFFNNNGSSEGASLSGTHNSGTGTGLGVGNPVSNTWGFVYAVKTTDDATKFVLVHSTLRPIRSNYVTLNTAFGADGWIYLGATRHGEVTANSGSLLDFVQSGNMTMFRTVYSSGNTVLKSSGFPLALGSGANPSLTYTYSAGGGSTNIPENFTHICLASIADTDGFNSLTVRDSSGTRTYGGGWIDSNEHLMLHWVPATEGLQMINDANAVDMEIAIVGWIDGALGPGLNPVL